MYKELYKYLVLNKKISFPGIGNFVVEDVPSAMDEVTHIIKPGQQIIRFSNNVENSYNLLLYSFLAKEQSQTEAEAENKFAVFIKRLLNNLQTNAVVLPALGTLKKHDNLEEKIEFIPQPKNIKHLFPLINLRTELKVAEKKEEPVIPQPKEIIQSTPVIEEPVVAGEEETVAIPKKREDSWWIYAIVLTLLAAAGMLYYYLYYMNQ